MINLNPTGGSYLSNSVVTVTATPAAGWVFAGWSGATNNSANPLELAMDANLSLAGTFAELPFFDQEPVGVTNAVGSTVSFSALAMGTPVLSYQWFFNNGSLSGATNATLIFTNVSSTRAGDYQIVVTNAYGSATSSVVSLTLTNSGGSTNVVYSADEGSLRAALSIGGWV
jgi:Divergent InlB B-repeat domain/Immunoglobulin I-set domain